MAKTVLGKALRAVSGPWNDHAEKLSGPDGEMWLAAWKKFLRKENPWPSDFEYDKTKEDWKLIEDSSSKGKNLLLDIEEFLKKVPRADLKDLFTGLGQRHAEYLEKNQDLIPREWRGKHVIFFERTAWKGLVNGDYIPFLFWTGNRWRLEFLRRFSGGWY